MHQNQAIELEAERAVCIYDCGNYLEARFDETGNKSHLPYRRLSKNEFIDTETGEVREYQSKSKEYKSLSATVQSLATARRLIYYNYYSSVFCCCNTIKYFSAMSDVRKLTNDLTNYHHRVKRLFEDYRFIDVIELGNNHAFHIHELLFFNQPEDFNLDSFQQIWGNKGAVYSTSSFDIISVNSYLTSYSSRNIYRPSFPGMSDINIWAYSKQNYQNLSPKEQSEIHHYIKNQRLRFYPIGFRNVRCSNNILKPERQYVSNQQFQELIRDFTLNYQGEITMNKSNNSTSHIYQQYLKTCIVNEKYKQKTEVKEGGND